MLNACQAGSFSVLADSSKELLLSIYMSEEDVEELDDWICMFRLLPKFSDLDLCIVAILSQHLSQTF